MARRRSSPNDVVAFDPRALSDLARDLKTHTDGKALRRDLTKGLREAAQPVARQAKQNASWSRRIPGAVKVGVLTGQRSAGVVVRVDRKKAPHARPYENAGEQGTFRHPVFGSDRWVAQRARPFLAPNSGQIADVERAVIKTLDTTMRRAGFK